MSKFHVNNQDRPSSFLPAQTFINNPNTCNRASDKDYLLHLLLALQDVMQSTHYHPEGDALFHSLQVFELAFQACQQPKLWAAALLHDIGKAVNTREHGYIGGQLLEGLLSDQIVWLTQHHLDLLKKPRRTRKKYRNTPQLYDLERLRRWDLQGRCVDAQVRPPEDALEIVLAHSEVWA